MTILAVRISYRHKWHLQGGCEFFEKIQDTPDYKEIDIAEEENDLRINEDNLCKHCQRKTKKKSEGLRIRPRSGPDILANYGYL